MTAEKAVPAGDITFLLDHWRQGDTQARDRVMELLYPRLRRLAGSHRNRFVRDLTLQTTELIHELYLQLIDQRHVDWQNRAHFFAITGRLLRRVAVDHERQRRRQKRGSGAEALPLEEALCVKVGASMPLADVLTLDAALGQLEGVDERAARVVELRYFAGLTHDETAEVLDIGRATVARSWRFARAWLRAYLERAEKVVAEPRAVATGARP